ncbi:MAG: glycoside hydrolase family 16 protein [Pedobacter sp.]|nr:glycoside hydrolase family 16 protein [Pedobacter sp.]
MKPVLKTAAVWLILLTGASYTTFSQAKTKKLIWSEEFNYKGLPNPKKWGYETGFVRNSEKQYYTKDRLENAEVNGGNLIITSIKEDYQGAFYTSASINTLGKQSFEGNIRVEIKAKLPTGKGIWPALWMMGTNVNQVGWPKCVEFDIMEFVGHTENTVHANLHWWDSASTQSNRKSSQGNTMNFSDLHTNYHVYGLERRGDSIKVFVDDQVYLSVKAPETAFSNSFKGPLYLLINTAVGGEWGGPIDDSIFPQKYYVDYVRVFRVD